MSKSIKSQSKLVILIVFILLLGLSLTACDSEITDGNGDLDNDNMTSGIILGKLTNSSIPISQREVKINDTLVTTNNNGEFQADLNSNKDGVSLANNNEKMIIEIPGFNKYIDYNWYEGKEARLSPYLTVVKVEPNSPTNYQHAFIYQVSSDYNPESYPDDYMTFNHKDTDLEYDLGYRETEWGDKRYNNKEDEWTPLDNIYTGQWEFNGIIEGESISGEFVVEPPEGLMDNSPEIIDYELLESSITVYFNIPHSVDRAWIRTSDVFHQIPESNLEEESINIAFNDLGIDPEEDEIIDLFIQTGNIGEMEFGLEIKSNGIEVDLAKIPGKIEEGVLFKDKNLEAEIKSELGIIDRDITESDLKDVEVLKVTNKNIRYLDGMELMENLKTLWLFENYIEDISPLKDLTSLSNLNLRDNLINKIEALSNLEILNTLNISQNDINDLSSLKNHKELKELYLFNNNVSNLEPIAGLNNLSRLNISNNKIDNISVLENLTSLSWLYFSYNKVEDITPLINNESLGSGDEVDMTNNYLNLSEDSEDLVDINNLIDRGINVEYEPQREN